MACVGRALLSGSLDTAIERGEERSSAREVSGKDFPESQHAHHDPT